MPEEELPQATALLDPKRPDCDYPFDELCGCGIGFKLIQALSESWNEPEEKLFPYLDLVATAIAADIVPMEGENRTSMITLSSRYNLVFFWFDAIAPESTTWDSKLAWVIKEASQHHRFSF